MAHAFNNKIYRSCLPDAQGLVTKSNALKVFQHANLDDVVIDEIWSAATNGSACESATRTQVCTAIRLIAQAQMDLPSDEVLDGDLPDAEFPTLPPATAMPPPSLPKTGLLTKTSGAQPVKPRTAPPRSANTAAPPAPSVPKRSPGAVVANTTIGKDSNLKPTNENRPRSESHETKVLSPGYRGSNDVSGEPVPRARSNTDERKTDTPSTNPFQPNRSSQSSRPHNTTHRRTGSQTKPAVGVRMTGTDRNQTLNRTTSQPMAESGSKRLSMLTGPRTMAHTPPKHHSGSQNNLNQAQPQPQAFATSRNFGGSPAGSGSSFGPSSSARVVVGSASMSSGLNGYADGQRGMNDSVDNGTNTSGSMSRGGTEAYTHPGGVALKNWSIPEALEANYYTNFEHLAEGKANVPIDDPAMRELFAKSRLPLETIQRVWKLCDIEKTHELDRDEFVMALHVCRILAHHTGSTVPHVLPTSIVPRDKRKQILSRREQQQQQQQQQQQHQHQQQHQQQAGLLSPSAHFSATKSAEERALVYEPSNIQFHSMSANNTPETLTSTRISEIPEQMSEDVEDDLFFAALHSGLSRDTTAAQATGSIDKVFDKINTHVDSAKGKATLASSLSKSSLNRNQRAKSTGSMVMTSAIDSTPEDAEGGAQSPHLPQPDDADEGKKKEKKSRFRNMLDSFTGSEEKRATTPMSSAANVATDGALHSEIHAMPTETGQATKDKDKDKKTKKSHERSQSLGGLLPTEAPIAETGRKGLARQASAFEQGTGMDNRPKEKEKDKDKGKPHTNIFGIFTKKGSKHNMPDSAAKDGTVAEKESMPTQEALVKQLEEADRLLKVQIEERNKIEALIKNAQNTDPASKDQIVS